MKKRITRFLTGLMIFSLMVPGISGCGNTSGDIIDVTTGNTPTEEGVDVCDASDTDSATEPDAAESSEEVGVLVDGYHQITATEAMKMMEEKEDYIILDVRTDEEYYGGHIEDAILVPNGSIGEDDIPELPDKNQLILVYCRSGRRSKDASGKLARLGYTNVYEFGGIINWPGPLVED